MTNKKCVWEEIRGFSSVSEYECFVKYISNQTTNGFVVEIEADPRYGKGELYGGRWFKDKESNEVWRLIAPDFPFRGLWEKVV